MHLRRPLGLRMRIIHRLQLSAIIAPELLDGEEAADHEAEEGEVAGHHGTDLDALESLAGEHGGNGKEGQSDHGEPDGCEGIDRGGVEFNG